MTNHLPPFFLGWATSTRTSAVVWPISKWFLGTVGWAFLPYYIGPYHRHDHLFVTHAKICQNTEHAENFGVGDEQVVVTMIRSNIVSRVYLIEMSPQLAQTLHHSRT